MLYKQGIHFCPHCWFSIDRLKPLRAFINKESNLQIDIKTCFKCDFCYLLANFVLKSICYLLHACFLLCRLLFVIFEQVDLLSFSLLISYQRLPLWYHTSIDWIKKSKSCIFQYLNNDKISHLSSSTVKKRQYWHLFTVNSWLKEENLLSLDCKNMPLLAKKSNLRWK